MRVPEEYLLLRLLEPDTSSTRMVLRICLLSTEINTAELK